MILCILNENENYYSIKCRIGIVTVYQGSYLAVKDVSFELLPGTDTAIVRPNDAGKSTLVKAVLDLIPRSAGTIEILGRPIVRLGRLRHLLGYMPQNFIFDRSFPISVSELVGLGWTNEGKRKDSFFSQMWRQEWNIYLSILEKNI